ncbi:hypothetical protein PFISCL1PPCAC_3038, partial [Pristionchus fissidentatus]
FRKANILQRKTCCDSLSSNYQSPRPAAVTRMEPSSNLTLAEELLAIPTLGPEVDDPVLSPADKWANLVDPMEGQSFPTPSELNYTIEEISSTPINGTETSNFTNEFAAFLERNDWLLWVAIGFGVVVVSIIVIIISYYLYKHRKSVIHQKHLSAGEGVQRQPSESNLENYKRPPSNMPPSRSTTMTRGGFLSTDPSTHDLHFTNIETASDVIGQKPASTFNRWYSEQRSAH